MSQPDDLQIQHLHEEIQKQILLPEERALLIDEEAGRALLSEINACQTQEELEVLTYKLSRSHLNDLFGAVLTLSAAAGEEPFNRLLFIFRKRATLSLAQTAWAYYQCQYPNDRLGRVLMTLIQSLPEKEDDPLFIKELRILSIDLLLPRRLANRLRTAKIFLPLDEKATGTDWSRLLLEYPLLPVYDSLSKTTRSADRCQNPLGSFMIQFFILPDTSFAASFLAAWFQDATDQEIVQNADLFIHALRISGRTAQQSLLRRYLQNDRLPAIWDEINEAILTLFGQPDLPLGVPREVPPVVPDPDPLNPKGESSEEGDNPEASYVSEPSGNETDSLIEKGVTRWFKKFGKKKNNSNSSTEEAKASTEQIEAKPECPAEPVSEPPSSVDPEQLLAALQQTYTQDIVQAKPESSSGSIWPQLDRDSIVRFRHWVLMRQIRKHSGSERKMMFFQRYALEIRSIQEWDEDTLLIEMDGFYIADHREEEDRLWYYDQNTIEWLSESHPERKLNQPSDPFMTSRDALLNRTTSNVVCLLLDSVNLLYSHDFIAAVAEKRNNT